MKWSWIWMLAGVLLCIWGLSAGVQEWNGAGVCLGLIALVFELTAVPQANFGFFSCGPGLLAALALVKSGGPGQAVVILLLSLAGRTLLHGAKSFPALACDLFCRGLLLAVVSGAASTFGKLSIVPAGLVYLAAWQLCTRSMLQSRLDRSQRSLWQRLHNWTIQHQIAILFLAPLLTLVVDVDPLYSLWTLPLLGVVYRAVQAESLRLQVLETAALREREATSRRQLAVVSSRLEGTQKSLEERALNESVLWELAGLLQHSQEMRETARIGLQFLFTKVPCHSGAILVENEGRLTLKREEPAGSFAWHPALEKAWRENRPLFGEGPYFAALPLGSSGVLYCTRGSNPPLRGGFSSAECTMLGNIAGQIGLGMQSARLFEEQRKTLAGLLQSAKTAAVGQLSAGLAHELNSPLGAVALQMDLAAQRLGSGRAEQAQSNLQAAQKSVEQVQAILKRLTFYSRDGAKAGQQVDLNQLIEDTLSFLQSSYAQQGLHITCRLQPLPPLEGNPNELQQVLLNLLSNAREAVLGEGAHGKEIALFTALNGDRRQLLVRDEGPGIVPEILERIFEPFFTTRPVGHGAGLGLSIAQGVVEAHGGRLLARNRADGRGAEFLLEF